MKWFADIVVNRHLSQWNEKILNGRERASYRVINKLYKQHISTDFIACSFLWFKSSFNYIGSLQLGIQTMNSSINDSVSELPESIFSN